MSELGNLSQCMMDSDSAANGRAKIMRGKALAASLIFEAAVIGGVLLWPLTTLGVLPSQLVSIPVPVYHGDQTPQPATPHRADQPRPPRPNISNNRIFQPPVIPAHIAHGADAEPPGIDANVDSLPSDNAGPWIPGGSDSGSTIEIARLRPEAKPRKISIGVMDGALLHRVEPDYPKVAKLMHLSGTVILRATIGTDGEVHGIVAVSGNPILAEAARAAVREWRYRPTLLDGQPVEVETRITVNFVLQ